MGKLTLLIVMAAVVGGSMLTLHTRNVATDTVRQRGEAQHDLLARDAAVSGQSLILTAMMDEDGFQNDLHFNERQTAAGRFTVDNYTPTSDRQEVTFTVTGHSGGATHTVRSKYEWDPMDFPGPLWLDVPYATAQVSNRATVNGGPGGLPTYFDRRLFDELNLGSLLSLATMQDSLRLQLDQARGTAGTLVTTDMLPLLDDLNASDARDLYYAAISAMTSTDVTVPGPVTVTNSRTYTGNKIVLHTGDLTIGAGGRIRGDGALVVEGALRVAPGGTLDWDGLVIVNSDVQLLAVQLDGTVRIDGSLVLSQLAVPPGGHMDYTVMKDIDGSWSSPAGNTTGSPAPWNGIYPFYQHKHRFDIELPEERTVYFAEEGGDRHEEWSRFRNTLNALGSQQVYLEFDNERYHGYATYSLDIDGEPQVYTGMVKNGFGTFSGSDTYRSLPFAAQDLNTFIVDVRSLRMLKQRFDGVGGCSTYWPLCIGENWDRREALTVRLRAHGSNARLYEGTLYWHMKSEEVAEHLAEEAAWRTRIESGEAFGTALTLGANVQLHFDIDPIETIGERLGFDGDEMIHRGSWANHMSIDQYHATGATPPGGTPPGGTGGTGTGGTGSGSLVPVCHRSGGQNQTLLVAVSELVTHLLHGDLRGACTGGGGSQDD